MHHKFRDLTGLRFGMLQAVRPIESVRSKWRWEFKCDCGNTCQKMGADVASDAKLGRTSNCGCMTGEFIARGQRTHGMSKHPAYAVYRSMIDRCRLPSHQAWHNYGGRGIVVCERWSEGFVNFWQDMGKTYRRGLEIDRRDNNGPYSPENCHWVIGAKQALNRRGNVRIATPDGLLTVSEASRLYGIGKTTLFYRIKNGWPAEKLLEAPDFRNREATGNPNASGAVVS